MIELIKIKRPPLPTPEEMPLDEWMADPDCVVIETKHWAKVRMVISVQDVPLLEAAFAENWRLATRYNHNGWRVVLQRRNPETRKWEMLPIGKLWTPNAEVIDHVNRRPLDNRRPNIRAATYSQNTINQRLRSDNTSGIRGVQDEPGHQRYHAQIALRGKSYHKRFWYCNRSKDDALKEAIAWRDTMALELHGEFAVSALNR